MAPQRTLPDHDRCDTHARYLLSCADYEGLLAESAGGCQLCSFPAARMPQRKLYIDHDYRGDWAVRGLLCISCNSGLGAYLHPTPIGADEYLSNAWFLRKLAERSLTIGPDNCEPPPGSIVADHTGNRWLAAAPDEWWPLYSKKQRRTWDQMYRRCGPLNMQVVEFRSDLFKVGTAINGRTLAYAAMLPGAS